MMNKLKVCFYLVIIIRFFFFLQRNAMKSHLKLPRQKLDMNGLLYEVRVEKMPVLFKNIKYFRLLLITVAVFWIFIIKTFIYLVNATISSLLNII